MLALALALQLAASPVTHCDSCGLLAQTDAPVRQAELERKISDLNTQIRAANTDWPPLSLAAAYAGYVLSPLVLIGGAFTAIALAAGSQTAFLLPLGVGVLVVGLAGVVFLIAGVVTGLDASSDAKAERQRLLDERSAVEEELRRLRTHQAASPLPAITLVEL
ncbi:MAG: hypothetical protein ACOZIN_19930 [Myxococcota bacterium]